MARSAYTYFHLPMIAGIIAIAAADELTVAHPGEHGTFAYRYGIGAYPPLRPIGAYPAGGVNLIVLWSQTIVARRATVGRDSTSG